MEKQWSNEYGNISISENVIAKIAGISAMECYGLVGMASRKVVQDGLADLLGMENLTKGIEVEIKDDSVELVLCIIVEYGTNINEVAKNIIDRVTYTLKNDVGIRVESVNVNVKGVRVGK